MPQQGSLKVAFGAEVRHQLATSADFRLVEDLVNGRSDLQLRTSKKENIQGFAKLSLIFADLPTSKR
jgi:hypothetical protein